MTRLLSLAAAIAIVAAALGIFASPAAAHEQRMVGPYTFVVGWIAEPAVAGQSNGLDLTVTQTAGGTPVEGLAKALTAEVIVGGNAARRTLELAADRDQPGHYTAGFVPTRTGDYTFHLTGTIGATKITKITKIDERFESGPGRFESVSDVATLQFPDRLPSASDVTTELAAANTKLTIALVLGGVALVVSIAGLATARRR